MRHRRANWLLICGSLFVAIQLPLLGYFLAHPIAFQWANAIRPGPIAGITPPVQRALDVRSIIAGIPYRSLAQVYAVNPPDRYQRTIVEGNGNCSNFANGLAYLLIAEEIPFQIVHFFPRDGFLDGMGHTILNTAYVIDDNRQVGIVDVIEGGIPGVAGRNLTLQDITGRGLHGVSIQPLNARHDQASPYYESFLDNSAVGVMDGAAVADYFRLLERFYVPLGNRQLETYFYRGLAIVLGLYPPIVVSAADYALLFGNHQVVQGAGRALRAFVLLDCAAAMVMLVLVGRRLAGRRLALADSRRAG